MTAHPLTQKHRAQQLLLRRATQAQVDRLWPLLDFDRLDATYPRFAAAAAALVTANGRTSAGLAVAYLRQFRRAAGIRGDAPLLLPDPIDVDQFATSLRVTSVVPVKRAMVAGTAPDVAMSNALTMARGSLARLVLAGGRETVTRSVTADSAARGYQRVLGGRGCNFCRMLAGRGAVYGKGTVDFEAHDHCGCTAQPVYGN